MNERNRLLRIFALQQTYIKIATFSIKLDVFTRASCSLWCLKQRFFLLFESTSQRNLICWNSVVSRENFLSFHWYRKLHGINLQTCTPQTLKWKMKSGSSMFLFICITKKVRAFSSFFVAAGVALTYQALKLVAKLIRFSSRCYVIETV